MGQSIQLSGTIMNDAQPVSFATIELKDTPENAIVASTMADSSGFYRFFGLQPGTYIIHASALGYKEFKSQAFDINSNQTINVVLELEHNHLEEVMVVADIEDYKQRTSSLDIEIVDDQFLDQNRGGSLVHSIEKIPGVNMIGIGAAQAKPMIRGMGFDRLLVIDRGVKHEAQQWGVEHGLEIDQFAVHQLEIIKGPASFMYGSNAIGGVIRFLPAPPPEEYSFGGDISLTGRSNNGLFGTAVSLYGRSDKWFVSGSASYQDYGDYRVPTDSVSVYNYPVYLYNNHVRNTAGRQAGIHFNTGYISEVFSSTFYISDVYSRNGFFANARGLDPISVDTALYDKSSRDILDPRDQVNHFKIINSTTFSLNDHFVEVESGYQNNFRQELFGYVPHGYMPVFYPDTLSIPENVEREYRKHVFSLNVNDKFVAGRHHFQVGMNGEYQNNRIDGYGFLVPSFDQYSIGLFAYDRIQLNEKLFLHTSVRYDNVNMQIYSYTDWFVTPFEENGTIVYEQVERAQDLTRNFNSLTGAVGLNYNLDDYIFKINAGKSFRVPIAKELGANGVNYHLFSFERGDINLDPEQSYQVDASVNYRKNKFEYQFSPFANYFPNYIYLNPTAFFDFDYGAGNQVYQYSQSEVFRSGGELSFRYFLTESISTELSGEYIYAIQLSGDKEGFTLPFTPPLSGNVNITYAPENIGRVYHPYFSVDTRLVAAQNNIVPPEQKTPGYVLLNLQSGGHIHFGKQTMDINLQVRNILNSYYLVHTSFYRLIGLPEEGVNVVLSLKMNLDFSNNI